MAITAMLVLLPLLVTESPLVHTHASALLMALVHSVGSYYHERALDEGKPSDMEPVRACAAVAAAAGVGGRACAPPRSLPSCAHVQVVVQLTPTACGLQQGLQACASRWGVAARDAGAWHDALCVPRPLVLFARGAQLQHLVCHLQSLRGRRLWSYEDVTCAQPAPASCEPLAALVHAATHALHWVEDLHVSQQLGRGHKRPRPLLVDGERWRLP